MNSQPAKHNKPVKQGRWIRAALIILAVILVALAAFLVLQYRSLRQEQLLNPHAWHWSLFLNHRAPLPVTDAGIIRNWMTFDYVNRLFALPPAYLKTRLNIAAPNYPRITVSAYASAAGLDAATALTDVQGAVLEYAAPTSTPTNATGTGAGNI